MIGGSAGAGDHIRGGKGELSQVDNPKDILTKGNLSVSELKVGNILDAKDYLENWYLAVVIEDMAETDQPGDAKVKLHFLPFVKNSKRDEVFSAQESLNRIAPAFTNSEKVDDPTKAVAQLREYLKTYLATHSERIASASVLKQQKSEAAQQQVAEAAATAEPERPMASVQFSNPFNAILDVSQIPVVSEVPEIQAELDWDQKQQLMLEGLETSYRHCPEHWDQDVGHEAKAPFTIAQER